MIRLAEIGYPEYFKWQFINDPSFDIEEWIKDELSVWDADNSDSREVFYCLIEEESEPKFYRAYHEWYIEDDGNEGWHINNLFNIGLVDRQFIKDRLGNSDRAASLRFVV